MKRQFNSLDGERFDFAIIGAGITGAALFYELSSRGKRCIIIDKNDFGSGTSQNMQRILHGGFRYLQKGDIFRIIDSIDAVNRWQKLFPAWVKPLPATIPIDNKGLQKRPILSIAAKFYDIIARAKHAGPWWHPSGTRKGHEALLSNNLRLENHGELFFYDAVLESPERAILELIRYGVTKNGAALNYADVTKVDKHAIQLHSPSDSASIEIHTKSIIYCTGPHKIDIEGVPAEINQSIPYLTGAHISVDGFDELDGSIGIGHEQGMLFANRFHERILFGSDWVKGAATKHEQSERIVNYGRAAITSQTLAFDDVHAVHQGIVPSDAKGQLLERPVIIEFDQSHRVIANKFTTALSMAAKWADNTIGAVDVTNEGPLIDSATSYITFPEAPWFMQPEVLKRRYGKTLDIMWTEYQQKGLNKNDWRSFWQFENEWAHTHDLAITDEDILRRRTAITSVAAMPNALKELV